MKKRKTIKRTTATKTKQTPQIISIHKWIIFGTICLVVGFMLSSSMQSNAKGKPVSPTPTPPFVITVTPDQNPSGFPKPTCDPSGEWCTGN